MQKVNVEFGERSYDIVIEGGSLSRGGGFVRECVGNAARKACVVTTETVSGLYLTEVTESLRNADFVVTEIVVPDGEEHKTLATYEKIMTRLLEERFERKSIMVPLGGGVIGDTAGFVAATYQRGIPFVQIPTTIVAQVDSSIGGKVAVNHPLGKNMIGSFYQPQGVWIDTRVLATLEHREIVSGMGEAVKHAMIRDRSYFDFLEENIDEIMTVKAPDDIMERFIAWNCRIKADVVSTDEKERGLRAILNYGHTVGHAIETVTGYSLIKHGEAVILGIVAAGRIAVGKGLLSDADFQRQNRLLARVGIYRDIQGLSVDAMLDAMTHDKKVTSGKIRFILQDSIGSVGIHDDVTEKEIKDSVNYMKKFVENL